MNGFGGWVARLWKRSGGWVGILLLLAGFVLVVFALPYYRQNQVPQPCPSVPPPSPAPPLEKGTLAVPLIPEEAAGVSINFWRSRVPQSNLFYLDAAKKPLPHGQKIASLPEGIVFDISKRPLDREGLDGSIAPEEYVAIAKVTAPKEVTVTVCANPGARHLDAGTYVGSLRIRDPRIEDVTVPIIITLQYPSYKWIAALFGVVVFIAGSFFVWASGKKADNKAVWAWSGGLAELPRWLLHNYVGVVAGTIAAISVFLATYWRNPAWGAKAPEEWFALFGATFTAYTATLTATSAVVPPRTGRDPAGDVAPKPPNEA